MIWRFPACLLSNKIEEAGFFVSWLLGLVVAQAVAQIE